ncbi:hypothetical protein BpHYR1_017164 [Brachionus plicatilis]|uniref:Uncharacterized protein n=1 Tax=Brachionus plicatilis TaxID=10195 RepID=A0A3M7REM0_BRAPC|nr:hypothetical protein BpHYR1_017164 [Brachionus plicatilis]
MEINNHERAHRSWNYIGRTYFVKISVGRSQGDSGFGPDFPKTQSGSVIDVLGQGLKLMNPI